MSTPSPLESLPTEILILILSTAARSPSDLGSLIFTSSTIYSCFLSYKSSILTAPALQDLGPVIRDAVALAHASTIFPATGVANADLDSIANQMRQYHDTIAIAIPNGPKWRSPSHWAADITPDLAIRILRLNQAVQFFIDLFMTVRCTYLAKQSTSNGTSERRTFLYMPPLVPSSVGRVRTVLSSLRDGEAYRDEERATSLSLHQVIHTKPLSQPERRRFAQAFFRSELLGRLYGVDRLSYLPGENRLFGSEDLKTRLFDSIPGSFTPWEMEQISQAHYFMHSVCQAVVYGGQPISERGWRARAAAPTSSAARAQWRSRGDWLRSVKWGWRLDMVEFQKRLVNGGDAKAHALPDPDPPFPLNISCTHPLPNNHIEAHPTLRELVSVGPGRVNGTCMATGGTSTQWFCASHRYRSGQNGWPPPGRPEFRSEEDEKQIQTVLPPPHAWTDALCGRSWDRWGLDMLFDPPPNQNHDPDPRLNEVMGRFSIWRWLGFVFYDRDRVENMKRATAGPLGGDTSDASNGQVGHGQYETGWLPMIWGAYD